MLQLRVLAPVVIASCIAMPSLSSAASAIQATGGPTLAVVVQWPVRGDASTAPTALRQSGTGGPSRSQTLIPLVQWPAYDQATAAAAPSGQAGATSSPSAVPVQMQVVQWPSAASGTGDQPVAQPGGTGTGATSASPPATTSQQQPAPSPATGSQPTSRVSAVQTLLYPGPAPSTPPANQASLAQQFLALVNQARAQSHEGPLADNPLLDQLALAKAQDLVAYNYFDHYSPRLGWPIDQEQKAGFQALYMGAENLAVAGSIQQAFEHLMASPTHQENLLDAGFTQTGIAIVVLPSANSILVEQLFAGPSN